MFATMATPPLFLPISLRRDAVTCEYVAGDLVLSNPIEAIVAEAYEAFGSGGCVACLLSLGCGHPGVIKAPKGSDLASWNVFLWKLVVESKETLRRVESQMSHLGIYHRLSVDHGLNRTTPMDQPAPGDILAYTASYLNEESLSRRMDLLLDTLILRGGVSSLEQLRKYRRMVDHNMVCGC
jgi:hypothetical protein